MGKRRTWKQYRTIDLALIALMLAIFEYLIITAANFWFPDQLYTASLAATVTTIVYMRWGVWGGLHAVEAGVIYCLFASGTREQYLIYCAGNLLSLLALIPLKKLGKETVRTGRLGLVFPLVVLLLMHVGRAAVALALGAAPADALSFFTTDSLSYLFTFVIIWIARKLDGVYEDQKHYLLRINSAEEE